MISVPYSVFFRPRSLCILIGVCAIGIGSAHLCQAGIIPPGTYTGTGAGNGTATVTEIGPPVNLDLITVSKAFTSVAPIDIVFAPVQPNDGVTRTYIVTEGVTNNTTETWDDYHIMLGSGSGITFTLGSPVTFPPVDSTYTHPFFTNQTVTSSEIDYSGGTVPPGQAISFSFSITVPDPTLAPINLTLRQIPSAIVPEAGSLALFSLAAAGIVVAFGLRYRG